MSSHSTQTCSTAPNGTRGRESTKATAIGLVITCSLLGACAQLLFKWGANRLADGGLDAVLSNYGLLGGYVLYGTSFLLLLLAMKRGELSVLYPILALTYVWVVLAAPIFFATEHLNSFKLLGVLAIVIGASLIGTGSEK